MEKNITREVLIICAAIGLMVLGVVGFHLWQWVGWTGIIIALAFIICLSAAGLFLTFYSEAKKNGCKKSLSAACFRLIFWTDKY